MLINFDMLSEVSIKGSTNAFSYAGWLFFCFERGNKYFKLGEVLCWAF